MDSHGKGSGDGDARDCPPPRAAERSLQLSGLPLTRSRLRVAILAAVAACAVSWSDGQPLTIVRGAAAQAPEAVAPPAWGTIDPVAPASGRAAFRVESLPADGRLIVPRGFPQIVRATLAGAAAPRDLAIDITADAATIAVEVPVGTAAPATIAIDTLEKSGQFADGRIGLAAGDAEVVGRTAKLESHPGNHRIGFWTDAADVVQWKLAATRWGMYEVLLTYSAAGPDGTEIAVDVGGTAATGRLAATGSWYRYTTLSLGKIYLAQAGEQRVAVRCTKKAGGAVMNLKAVSLLPACEGKPPVQATDGSVLLHGRDATVRGTTLRYEPAEKKQTLGFWVKPTDAAEWSFTLDRGGAFDVEVLQGCGPGNGGSPMRVEFDGGSAPGTTATFVVEETTGFQDFRARTIGRVTLAAGGHVLRIAPEKIAAKAACDIRQVRLVPVP